MSEGTMKVKLSTIVAAVEGGAIQKLENSSPPWKARVACARFTEAVLGEYHRSYQKLYNKAVFQYGVPVVNEKGQKIIVVGHPSNTEANLKAFGDAIEALLESDVELATAPLSAAELGEAVSMFTVGDIRALGPLLGE